MLRISFSPLFSIGSTLLTLRAIFFSLFIAENCFIRLKTAESRGLSGATPSSCTHGWPAWNCDHSLAMKRKLQPGYTDVLSNIFFFLTEKSKSSESSLPLSYRKPHNNSAYICHHTHIYVPSLLKIVAWCWSSIFSIKSLADLSWNTVTALQRIQNFNNPKDIIITPK